MLLPAALGLALIKHGYRVLFTHTTDLTQRLQVAAAESASAVTSTDPEPSDPPTGGATAPLRNEGESRWRRGTPTSRGPRRSLPAARYSACRRVICRRLIPQTGKVRRRGRSNEADVNGGYHP